MRNVCGQHTPCGGGVCGADSGLNGKPMSQTDRANSRRTREYFNSWRTYQEEVETCFSELYRNCAKALNGELSGRVLDVGSGGVFNYDVAKTTRMIAVDYAVQAINLNKLPPRVDLVQGDGTRLPFADGSFDCVVMQFLIHHLALRDHRLTVGNVNQCLQECTRVVREGGKILIVESCVPGYMERVERVLYPMTRQVLELAGQPMVFQFSLKTLGQLLAMQKVDSLQITPIPIGKQISQFGLKVPGYLSPCLIRLFAARKRSG